MVKRASSLIDPSTGKPIVYDDLTREIAGPTMGGVRSILSGHPAQGLDPARLARILRSAEEGNAEDQFALAEEIEEKYLHYQGTLGTRKRAVSQLEITVEAGSDAPDDQDRAQFIRDWLARDTLEEELFDILDAVGKGVSFTEVAWDLSGNYWLPARLENRDGRWFEFDRIDGKTPRLRGGPDGMSGTPTDLPPFRFIVHHHPAKTGLPLRGGLIRGVAWAYLFQNFAVKDWVIFAEVYGMPVRLGRYGPNATADEKRILLRAVTNLATDAAAIIPDSMKVEFAEAQASGNYEVYERLCQYLDQQVSKAVLGQTATTDAVAGGLGGSQGNVHNDVREDIQRADAKKLAATLNTGLVRWMIDFNFGAPASGRYPRINIGQSEKFGKEEMALVETFVALGGRVEESVIRDKLALPDPPETGADGQPVRLLKAKVSAAQNPAPADTIPPIAAPGVAVAASSASVAGLEGLMRGLKIGAASSLAAASTMDAIDAAVADMADQWQPVTVPMFDPLQKAFDASASYEDLKVRLLAALDKMDVRAMAELLAEATFMARLAGESGNALQ